MAAIILSSTSNEGPSVSEWLRFYEQSTAQPDVSIDLTVGRLVRLEFTEDNVRQETTIDLIPESPSPPLEKASNILLYRHSIVCVAEGEIWRLQYTRGFWNRERFFDVLEGGRQRKRRLYPSTGRGLVQLVNAAEAIFDYTAYYPALEARAVTRFKLLMPPGAHDFDPYLDSPKHTFLAMERYRMQLEHVRIIRRLGGLEAQVMDRQIRLDEERRQRRARREAEEAEEAKINDEERAAACYSRSCGVCFAENPSRRAALVECGHIACLPCVRAIDREANEGALSYEVACPFCRVDTTYVRLFEDVVEK